MPKRVKILAEVISFLTNPIFVLIGSILYIAFRFSDSTHEFWSWSLFATALLIVPALLFTSYDWYKDRKIDIDISTRRERLVPMMLATLGAVIGSFLVNTRTENQSLLLISYVLVAMLLSLTIITFVWKISLHTSTMSAVVMLVIVFGSPWYVFVGALAIIAVAWSRVILKQHTLAQTVAGSLAGVIITFFAWLIFRI